MWGCECYNLTMVISEKNCFFPDDFLYAEPSQLGFEKQHTWIDDRLLSWLILPNCEPRGTIVHLHGNAQNMSSHFVSLTFLLEAGFQLITFDYSGYGKSRGVPSLNAIQADALSVFRHVFGNPALYGTAIYGFGQSMGAYTLARILPEISGLKAAILEAGLTSFYDLYNDIYPEVENLVPQEGFSALETLPHSKVPKLFVHGRADDVVPYEHSVSMHAVAGGPKQIVLLDGVAHLDAVVGDKAGEYKRCILDFLKQHSCLSP